MADVLELVGIPYLTSTTKSGGKHVEFVSVDKCKVTNLAFFKKNSVVDGNFLHVFYGCTLLMQHFLNN